MRFLFFIPLLFIYACEKENLNIDNIKVKSISRIQQGLQSYNDSYKIEFEYNGSKITGTNIETFKFEGDKITSTEFYDSISYGSQYEVRLENYSFIYHDSFYTRNMDSMVVTIHTESGNQISAKSDRRDFYYNENSMVDSIVIVEFGKASSSIAYIYDDKNNITEKRLYSLALEEPYLGEVVVFTYANTINPIYFLYRQLDNVIIAHLDEFIISYNLPTGADYYDYGSDGERKYLFSEDLSSNNSEDRIGSFKMNNTIYAIEYY